MKPIVVLVGWSGNNFTAGLGDPQIGVVLATAKTYDQIQKEFKEALEFHIEGMALQNDPLPQWAVEGQYELHFQLNCTALLHIAQQYTTMAAISRASGVSQNQLNRYAEGVQKPRPAQRQRIIEAIHKIGQACMEMK